MKKIIACGAIALSLSVSPALSQNAPPAETVLPPGGELPVGMAANFAVIGPAIGSLFVFVALASDSSNSTTSTVSTTD